MRNVRMIRTEPDLVWIPLEKAVYCENCKTVSSSCGMRCGFCGSEQIVPLVLTARRRGTQARHLPQRWQHSDQDVVILALIVGDFALV